VHLAEKRFLDHMAQAVLKEAEGLARGDLLAHETIEAAAGVGRYTEHWTSVVKKVRAGLLETRGIALLAVVGSGYRLCTPAEQVVECSRRRQRRALRQVRRGIQEVGATPNAELSEHLQRVKGVVLSGLARQKKAVLAEARRQVFARRPESMPRPMAGR
jgi:hypothetical protein